MTLEIHDTLASTQDTCAARAASGAPDGFAVLARHQTHARGTRGRLWESLPANLFLSVLLRNPGLLADIGWVPLLCGVAAMEALAPHAPGRVSLKWPNDLMLDGAKLGGILIEGAAHGPTSHALIAGFGINIAAAPALPGRPTACLADACPSPPDAETLARALLARIAAGRDLPRDGVVPAWQAWGPAHGTPLTVVVAGGRHHGAYDGLTPRGHLRLLTADGPITLAAGEVVTPAAPADRTPPP